VQKSTSAPYVNSKKLTDHEQQILMFMVEGTYHVVKGNMECDYNELNEEYSYLNDAKIEHSAKHIIAHYLSYKQM
jgi:hypothetical protein